MPTPKPSASHHAFWSLLRKSLKCTCPRCGKSSLYRSIFSFDIIERCPECGLDLSKNDSADGPAVFLIFILGFSIVPLALFVAMIVEWPLWVHGIIWGTLTLVSTLGALKPLKSYVIALQYHYRPNDFEED